ncbi:MAG: polyketide cyclase [Proteobacteria bacterium ST_bin12]|nr:MAG: polyketide cyclase [Proteobacteria bacterium ST_bin12]
MNIKHTIKNYNPELDLVLERIVDVPKEAIWAAWTTPELLKPWFCPLPWKTIECEIDLRAGGIFRTVMQSPEGQQFDNTGCYLEIIPNQKLVWTNSLKPEFRPAKQVLANPDHPCEEFMMTASILLETVAGGTKYTAHVMHAHPEARIKHEQMGFEQGWGICLDQLIAMIKNHTH